MINISSVSRQSEFCMCVCACRLNREEGDGAWCPEGQLEPSDSQYLQVCVRSALSVSCHGKIYSDTDSVPVRILRISRTQEVLKNPQQVQSYFTEH